MKQIIVFGLGYVGLPLALALAKDRKIIGYDSNNQKIEAYKNNIDPNHECTSDDFLRVKDNIMFSSDVTCLANEKIVLVTVPTPVDVNNIPDLKPLRSASETLGTYLVSGDLIIYESTVYPGVTEEFCVPILERKSGLCHLTHFNVGYSPERINPGDKERKLGDVVKIISADSADSLNVVKDVYAPIITAGLYAAASIKVAEAAKALENTQRDVNIALMNEMAMICEKIGISTFDVIDAASTKWNFLKFSPGLVGGHCIGVDPYYLTHMATDLGYTPELILAGRRINESMPAFIVDRIIKRLNDNKKTLSKASVLIFGLTFKENVSDIRNSKVIKVASSLSYLGLSVDTYDPYASDLETLDSNRLESLPFDKSYDCVIFAVSHDKFNELEAKCIKDLLAPGGFVMDIKGVWRDKLLDDLGSNYLSL